MLKDLQQIEKDEINDIDLESEESKERFKIRDLNQLNWALRKLSVLNSEYDAAEQMAEIEIERIKGWLVDQQKTIENKKAFFEGLIKVYAAEQRATNPDFKSAKTPYGRIGFRAQPQKWIYNQDTNELIKYLQDSGYSELVKVKMDINRNDMKKVFIVQNGRLVNQETGEIVPGVNIENQPEIFSIKAE